MVQRLQSMDQCRITLNLAQLMISEEPTIEGCRCSSSFLTQPFDFSRESAKYLSWLETSGSKISTATWLCTRGGKKTGLLWTSARPRSLKSCPTSLSTIWSSSRTSFLVLTKMSSLIVWTGTEISRSCTRGTKCLWWSVIGHFSTHSITSTVLSQASTSSLCQEWETRSLRRSMPMWWREMW